MTDVRLGISKTRKRIDVRVGGEISECNKLT